MVEERKDFKEVRVKVQGGAKEFQETLSRSMLYSGVNIFGQLTELYMQSKDEFMHVALQQSGQQSNSAQNTSQTTETSGEVGSGASGMMNLNQDVLQIFKRMQKRDAITKIKAFGEMGTYVDKKVEQGSEELGNLLTFFLYHMCRILLNERDKKVREAAQQAFSSFIKKGKRKLGPHLKKVLPLWVCSFFDPSPEVAKIARLNFDAAFPQEKQGQVFKLVYKNFLHFANEQLRQSEKDTGLGVDGDANMETFDRITSSVLFALGHSFKFIENWTSEEQETYIGKMLDILDLRPPEKEEVLEQEQSAIEETKKEANQVESQQSATAEAIDGDKKDRKTRGRRGKKGQEKGTEFVNRKAQKNDQTQKDKFIWSFLGKKYRDRVRAACLQFVNTFVLKMPREVVLGNISQISPLVFGLISDENSMLQTTLWKEALFNLGKNYPESWKFVTIKKDVIPNLNKCLREAGFGAPVTLYQNVIKFVSILPLYNLQAPSESSLTSFGRQNKASFKDQCNLLREVFANLYAGLQNEEAPAFHFDLISSFFQILTFVILKRISPLVANGDIAEVDIQFALEQLSKIIAIPEVDFVENYVKFGSRAQNMRNIRVSIPQRFAKMLLDLADRECNQKVFKEVCLGINSWLTPHQINSTRVISALTKEFGQIKSDLHQTSIVDNVFVPYLLTTSRQISKELGQASKTNIDTRLAELLVYRRLVYTLNKRDQDLPAKILNSINSQIEDDPDVLDVMLPAAELLVQFKKKELLAIKVLEDSYKTKFAQIKRLLVEIQILIVNLNWDPQEDVRQLFDTCITSSDKSDILTIAQSGDLCEKLIYLPANYITSPKLSFEAYYEYLKEETDLHEVLFDNMSAKMLEHKQINAFKDLIDQSISEQQKDKACLLSEEDVDVLKGFIVLVLSDQTEAQTSKMPMQTLAAYFQAARGILAEKGDEQNEELRGCILDMVIKKRVKKQKDQQHFNSIWTIFVETMATRSDYQDLCIERFSSALSDLIADDSNNLDGVSKFMHLKTIISKYAHLQTDKLDTLRKIVLHEENFASLEENPLPLKMFRDLFLDGSINFDMYEFIKRTDNSDNSVERKCKFEFEWLLAKFLNMKYLVSLSQFLELKSQLVLFCESDVIPTLMNADKELLIDLCSILSKNAVESKDQVTTTSWQLTFEYFVGRLVDPGEEFPIEMKPILKIDEFKQIFHRTVNPVSQHLLETNFAQVDPKLEDQVTILIKFLSQTAYYLLDEPVVVKLFKQAKQNLMEAKDKEDGEVDGSRAHLKEQIQIYMIFQHLLQTGDDQKQTETTFQMDLLNSVLKSIEKIDQDKRQALQNVAVELLFRIIDSDLSKKVIQEQINKVDLHQSVIDLLMAVSEEAISDSQQQKRSLDCAGVIKLCSIVKQTLSWTENGPTIVSLFVQAVKDRAEWFDRRVSAQLKQMEGSVQQLEVEMLQHMADTLVVCSSQITIESLKANVEDNLYYLLGCRVIGLQKASYVLLKFIYGNFILPVGHAYTQEDEERQLRAKFDQETNSDPQNPSATSEKQQAASNVVDTREESKKEGDVQAEQSMAFKNVSLNLISLIDSAPDVIGSRNQTTKQASVEEESKANQLDFVDQFLTGGQILETLVFGQKEEGCMNAQIFGYLLAWNAVLTKIEQGRIKVALAQDSERDYQAVLAALTDYLEQNNTIYQMLLVSLVPYLPYAKKTIPKEYRHDLASFEIEYADIGQVHDCRLLCLQSLINFMKSFPSLGRRFYQECDKKILEITTPYIKQIVSPALLDNEIKKIELSQAQLGANSDLTFVLFKSTKEIEATYNKSNEVTVQIKLKIPPEYPLKSVSVEMSEGLKLKQAQIRKWSLSIRNLIASRNGDIISAIMLWKSNIDKEMDGVEECHICYCVLHGTDRSLPSISCANCENKFHVACIRKWFNTSNKSNCPLCQTFFWH